MDLGIQGRTAIVCAASGGLGKATALSFAREGANVVICSRDRSRVDSAAREIRSAAGVAPSAVLALVADLTRREDITSMIGAAATEFGRIDILVTNAGGPPVALFPDLDDATWDRGFQLTLMSVVRCIRAVLPHMEKQKWGRIVNITSIAARQPVDDLILSSTLRPGILGLTKVLSNQLAEKGILINNVAPGYILTDRQMEIARARGARSGISPEQVLSEIGGEAPAGRLGMPEELADVIVFLSSARASYITGATIGVDGGLSRGLW
jgi:3-oxoacyl-[acyl-carrier protein] reductase